MMPNPSYFKAFLASLLLHLFIAAMLLIESFSARPVLTEEVKNEEGSQLVKEDKSPEPDIVKAVSVDKQEVMQAVNRLKQEKIQAARIEQSRQKALNQQLEKARQERLQEQKHVEQLKKEADELAMKRKKDMEEEQKHLKELAEKKEQELKKLEQLKKEQKDKQLALQATLKEKQKLEEAKAQEAREAKEAKEKLAEKERLAEAARTEALKAAAMATQRAKMMGEVDKYKALIRNAIGERWILPENVDSSLSSQFQIRLAPDGAVLAVSLTRSSGDPLLDRSAESAIYKASPLPVPSDPATFEIFRNISLTVRPENVRG